MQISQRMWSLWPQIIQCFYEWAVDYLDHISGALENFVCRGNEHFLAGQNPSYLQQVLAQDACVGHCVTCIPACAVTLVPACCHDAALT